LAILIFIKSLASERVPGGYHACLRDLQLVNLRHVLGHSYNVQHEWKRSQYLHRPMLPLYVLCMCAWAAGRS